MTEPVLAREVAVPLQQVAPRRGLRAWAGGSAHRRVLATGMLVGLLTGLVQLASMGKEVIVAGYFGPGDQLDAFFIAYMLPAFAINVLAWTLNSALVPAYVRLRERGGDAAAAAMFANVTARTLTLLAGTSVLLGLVFPFVVPLLASGFDADKLALTRALFYILLPSLTLSALAVVWSGILNVHDSFASPAGAPVLVPLATLFVLVVAGRAMGVHAIAAGLFVGTALQCGMLAIALRRRSVPLRPRWTARSADVTDVFRQYVPAMAGGLLASSTAIVDQSMSAMLGSGSVATLNYGSKLVSAILSVGMMAIGTAVLPSFSRLAARESWGELQEAFKRYAVLLLGVTIPLTMLLVVLSAPIVRLLFERGAFSPDDTLRVTRVQQLFALQVPCYLFGILVVRLISALRRNDMLLWGAVLNVVLNVTFNLVLMRRFGLAGIAFSTSLVYLVSCLFLGLLSNRLLKARITHAN